MTSIRHIRPFCTAPLIALAASVAAAPPVSAQDPAPAFRRTERVTYANPGDSMLLDATLTLPPGMGPHPGVVVLSVAGTDALVERLTGDGYAVLTPVRRGFVAVEPLLRATYRDLADDVLAALDHLGAREGVDGEELALVAQADDTPSALLAVAGSEDPVPLILLAPPILSGVETFRREQRWLAERDRMGDGELRDLDRYVDEIAEIVLNEPAPYVRERRLRSLRERSSVELPRNAAFPADDRQAHFFASPLWRDRLAFDPTAVMARLASPVLILIGDADADTTTDAYLDAVERAISAAPSPDATVCLIPGRTRHAFTEEGVTAIADWLAGRDPTPEGQGAHDASGDVGCVVR